MVSTQGEGEADEEGATQMSDPGAGRGDEKHREERDAACKVLAAQIFRSVQAMYIQNIGTDLVIEESHAIVVEAIALALATQCAVIAMDMKADVEVVTKGLLDKVVASVTRRAKEAVETLSKGDEEG